MYLSEFELVSNEGVVRILLVLSGLVEYSTAGPSLSFDVSPILGEEVSTGSGTKYLSLSGKYLGTNVKITTIVNGIAEIMMLSDK